MDNTAPFKKEFRLIILTREPLVESDLELIKDALAQASAPFYENDGITKQHWLLVEGETETDLNMFQ